MFCLMKPFLSYLSAIWEKNCMSYFFKSKIIARGEDALYPPNT